MIKLTPLLAACVVALPAWAAAPAELPLERLFADPPLQGRLPRQAELSPGGGWVSFLRPSAQDSEQLELWAQPAAGGAPRRLVGMQDLLGGREAQLTEAERMALERKRITQRGITGYQWCGRDDRTLLLPLSGDLYLLRLGEQGVQTRRLTEDESVPEQDPQCSPDGRLLAYVKRGELVVQALDGGAPRTLTEGASETRFFGLAEFIAAEELGRHRGYWWSPDGSRLLVLEVDESGVPVKTRAQIFADRSTMTQQRYPAAGEANARVRALSVDPRSGARQPLPLPAEAEYIARAGFFDDGTPWLQWFTRDQRRLVLTEFDAAGRPRQITEERDPAWVEVHDDLAEMPGLMLSGKPALLWSSEASGRRQLLLLDRVSGARRALTQEPEPVGHRICSSATEVVYSVARERGRSQELFAIDVQGRSRALPGAQPRQWRDAKGDEDCRRLLVTRSAWGQPPQLALQALDGKTAAVALAGDAADPLLAQIVPQPRELQLSAADGRTPLNGFYFAPLKPGAATARHPVIVLAYGGPGAATVKWSWSRDTALIAYWQRRGYGVMALDTRGMAHRDRDFTRAHHRAFGAVEVADLFAAVRQLPAQVPQVDAARIGFFGWSYGGFLAARAMLDADTPFAAAAAGAPPTDWTLYDTAYTERYLGLPDGGKAAPYAQANLLARAALLQRPLLLIHGTADDNVLFENTLRLTQALQQEGKLFDLMVYPGHAHGVVGRRPKLHLHRVLDAFFDRHLQP